MSRKLSRRGFVKSFAAGAAVVSIPFTARSYAAIVGSNEAIQMGVIGFGGRGREAHVPSISKDKGFRLTALCDADQAVLEAGTKTHAGVQGFLDMRKMFDSQNVDA